MSCVEQRRYSKHFEQILGMVLYLCLIKASRADIYDPETFASAVDAWEKSEAGKKFAEEELKGEDEVLLQNLSVDFTAASQEKIPSEFLDAGVTHQCFSQVGQTRRVCEKVLDANVGLWRAASSSSQQQQAKKKDAASPPRDAWVLVTDSAKESSDVLFRSCG